MMRARALGPGEAWSGPAAAAAAPRPLLRRAAPALLLALLLLLAFRGVVAGRVIYLRDAVQNHGPLRALVADRLRAGEWPLWNPLHGAGTPLLANPDALVFHPTTLLFLVLPREAALTASVLLMTVLLAAGGWLLARAAGSRREGAALAAAILAFSGPSASLASMQNILGAFAFVPLALWALLRAARSHGPAGIAAAAAACAPILIAAEPASILAWLLGGAALLLVSDRGAGGDAVRPGRAVVILLAVLGVAALLAAPQILPARELLPWTPRAGGLPPVESLRWSLLPERLPEIVVPRLFGDPTRLSPGAWWGRFAFEGGYPFLFSLYLGALPCLLAAIGLGAGGAGRARRHALGAVGALGVLLALGGHAAVYRAFHAILPAVRQIRYPERFLLVALPAAALLAAAGLDRILERSVDRRAVLPWLTAAAVAAFIVLTCVAAAPGLVDAVLARLASVPEALFAGGEGAAIRGSILNSCLWLFAETLILAIGAGLALRPGAAPPRRLGFGLVGFAGVSMILAAAPALSTAAPGWLWAPSPLRDAVGRGAGAPRLHHDARPAGLSIWARTDEIIWGFRFDRFSYALLTGHHDRVPTVFDPATDRMDLKAQADAGRALAGLPLPEKLKVLRVAHAGFLLSHDVLREPGLTPGPVLEGFSVPPLRVYGVDGVLPRARFRAAARPPAWPADPARSLADPRYDPLREVLLEDAPSRAGGPEDRIEAPVTIAEDRAECVRLRVDAPAPGWVVLADAWAPGWRAEVDGAPAPVLRADGLFRAVPVPPGRHEVVMTYAPRGLRSGLWLSGAGMLIAAGCALAGRRRERR